MALTFNDPLTFKQDVKSSVEPIIIYRINDPTSSVSLYINPQRISIRQSKVMQQVQTNTGWVFQHWGYEPIVISYSGVTGYINPWKEYEEHELIAAAALAKGTDGGIMQSNLIRILNDTSPYTTPAYKALAKLRVFYEEPQKQLQGLGADLTKITADVDTQLKQLALKFLYRADAYEGYLTRFEFNESEDSPWMWNYTMEFKAYTSNYDTSTANLLHTYRGDAIKEGKCDDEILKSVMGNLLNNSMTVSN